MIKFYTAKLDKLYDMLDFIRNEAHNAGFDDCYINKIELATEEVLVNIINYGYPGGKAGQISIECALSKNSDLEIIIKDEGIPYNPLKTESTCDCQASLDERNVGGYGIFFIINLMDEVIYKREQNFNILTLKKFQPRPELLPKP